MHSRTARTRTRRTALQRSMASRLRCLLMYAMYPLMMRADEGASARVRGGDIERDERVRTYREQSDQERARMTRARWREQHRAAERGGVRGIGIVGGLSTVISSYKLTYSSKRQSAYRSTLQIRRISFPVVFKQLTVPRITLCSQDHSYHSPPDSS